MDLQGKRALVTGGTRGLGAAIAADYARHGASVVINSRSADDASQATLAELNSDSVRGHFIAADIAKPAECQRLVRETVDRLGGIDILVHNAGGPCPGDIETVSPDDWMLAFDTHVHAAYHLVREALPHMRKQEEGVVVLVSSAAGIRGCPGAIAYGVVKGAVLQMTRALARDLADDNLRVNCVAPGIIRTRFHETMTAEQQSHNLKNRIPLHREGAPDQVAEVVHLLTTNDFMTGETIVVDGGMTMQIVR